MGAGTGGAGWATAHPGKNEGGHGPHWKYQPWSENFQTIGPWLSIKYSGEKMSFCPWWPWPLFFDHDLQTRPNEGPNTSSVWIWRKSVQRFPRYFINKKVTDSTNKKLIRRWESRQLRLSVTGRHTTRVHFRRRKFTHIFIRFYAVSAESYRIHWNNAK